MHFSLRLSERRTILIVGDLFLVNLTTLLALWIMAARARWSFDGAYLAGQAAWFPFLSALWLFSAFLMGFYDPRRMADLSAAADALVRVIALVTVIYFTIYFLLATPGSLPRGVVGYQGAMSFFLIGLLRIVIVVLIQRPAFGRPVIIVGAGWAGQTMAAVIHAYAGTHYQIVGFVDDDADKRGTVVPALADGFGADPQQVIAYGGALLEFPVLGTCGELVDLVKTHSVPEIVLAVTQNISSALFQALLDCKEQGVQITLMPVLFEQLTGQVPIEHIGDNWNVALPLDSAEAGGFYPILKRVFDVVTALVGLACFLILLPAIAIAIRLDSPGPVIYMQERVGKGGRRFRMLKLRTMVVEAELDGHAQRATTNDPRVTRVGRLLRRLRLDEIPQVINVLKGEMSAVGPRPERAEHLRELDRLIPFHRLRNAVKPGMAGWAVVNYDYVESVDDARIRLQYDLYYIKHQSIWLDFIILLRTMGSILTLRGR